jgi:hypothetical protein
MVFDTATILQILIPLGATALGYLMRHWGINVPFLPAPVGPVSPPGSPPVSPPSGLPLEAIRDKLVAAVLAKLAQTSGAAPGPGQSTHPIMDALLEIMVDQLKQPSVPARA